MKTLKITLIAAIFFISVTSCTKESLNDDNVLADDKRTEKAALIIGGGADD